MEPIEHENIVPTSRSGVEDAMGQLSAAGTEVEKAFDLLHDKIGTLCVEEVDRAEAMLESVRPPHAPFAGRVYDEADRAFATARRIRAIAARIDL